MDLLSSLERDSNVQKIQEHQLKIHESMEESLRSIRSHVSTKLMDLSSLVKAIRQLKLSMNHIQMNLRSIEDLLARKHPQVYNEAVAQFPPIEIKDD